MVNIGFTFDVEILDSRITSEIARDVSVVFAHWPGTEIFDGNLLRQGQRISKWRPKQNVALITNTMDLRFLAREMPKHYLKNDNITAFKVMFQHENVLRLCVQ